MTFKSLFTESTKYKLNGITATFKDKAKVDDDEIVKLLRAYDTQTWAIDSLDQKKRAEASNKIILKKLGEFGKGEIEFKTGRTDSKKIIEF